MLLDPFMRNFANKFPLGGTDLHTYNGRVPTDKHLTLGHENMGIVEAVGNGVSTIKVGEYELDYLLLADIWPTAWFCLESAGQVGGDTVVVFGAGN